MLQTDLAVMQLVNICGSIQQNFLNPEGSALSACDNVRLDVRACSLSEPCNWKQLSQSDLSVASECGQADIRTAFFVISKVDASRNLL